MSKSKTVASPILKFRSVAKIDASNGKRYNLSIALRENGRLEVYSNFVLVNDYYNPMMQVVDIETDFYMFYIKFASDCHEIENGQPLSDIKFENYKILP